MCAEWVWTLYIFFSFRVKHWDELFRHVPYSLRFKSIWIFFPNFLLVFCKSDSFNWISFSFDWLYLITSPSLKVALLLTFRDFVLESTCGASLVSPSIDFFFLSSWLSFLFCILYWFSISCLCNVCKSRMHALVLAMTSIGWSASIVGLLSL